MSKYLRRAANWLYEHRSELALLLFVACVLAKAVGVDANVDEIVDIS